jgi:hypothetical protein
VCNPTGSLPRIPQQFGCWLVNHSAENRICR